VRQDIQSQEIALLFLALHLACCVPLDRSLPLSEPRFPHFLQPNAESSRLFLSVLKRPRFELGHRPWVKKSKTWFHFVTQAPRHFPVGPGNRTSIH
jgi:hypothetical protein